MIGPRFDFLAPHYAWIEALSFGPLLQWCRTALLSEVADARRVLILGEGDGRFLTAFLAVNVQATVDVVDASAAMLAVARSRIAARRDAGRVDWHIADALRFQPPSVDYDLIVTNFFLDCFSHRELAALIAHLARCLKPGGRWLVGDFELPQGTWQRVAARTALAGMYAFFAIATRIPARWLADPAPYLRERGLAIEREERRLGGFLVSRLWRMKNDDSPPMESTL